MSQAGGDVVVVAYDGAELADVACVTTALSLASRLGAASPYDVDLVSTLGDDIRCDSGLTLRANAAISDIRSCDTIIVSGGTGHSAAADDVRLIRHIQRLARGARQGGLGLHRRHPAGRSGALGPTSSNHALVLRRNAGQTLSPSDRSTHPPSSCEREESRPRGA